MKNMHRIALAGALLVAGTAFAATSIVRSQDDAQGGDVAAMMAEMMKFATPGAEHEALMQNVGEWEQTYKHRMSPDAPWIEGTGTSTAKSILGGRYLLEELDMNMMGMEMQGFHLLGFDLMKQEYVSLWADSMSTWWVTARGKETKKGFVETTGTMVDIAGERPYRMTTEHRADGSIYSEMFDTIPPAGEVKVMEITARKKKG